MLAGRRNSRQLRLGISLLNQDEKTRVINVLKDKYGLTATLNDHGRQLSIKELDSFIHHIRPYFHESQLYRLEQRGRKNAR